jgi:predicted alpha/beta hydrolase family esterase
LAELTIVGHSLGVTAALDFIEQAQETIKKLVSVSGFAIDYGAELNGYYLREKTIDFAKVRANLKAAAVFYADDDPYVTQHALQQLADLLHVEPTIIHEGGHLNSERGYTTFPAVLQASISD